MHTVERLALRCLTAADALGNRLYGWRFNPLYQSGTIVVALYLVLVATGLWLILFYRVGAPWESVNGLTANLWIGNWVRGLHRYASDAAVVATAVHAVRMFAQGRSWGRRTLAWTTGVVLLLLLMVCGWTGYVLVWDTFGEYLARSFARMLDTLPVLSEPIGRAFTGERPVPSTFFFIMLFAHIGLPLGMGVVFWLHVKRVARPVLLPPRPLMWTAIALLTAVAIAWPLTMAPKADPFELPGHVPADLLFAFWVPILDWQGAGVALASLAAGTILLMTVPLMTARRGVAVPPPSVVDEDICTGCVQCSLDCPYAAIEMISRSGPRSDLVARVDPTLCVSCGICSGSCAPMGVGPPGRTGRDQIAAVRTSSAARQPAAVVVIGCEHGAGTFAFAVAAEGARFQSIRCAGNLHTSAVELLLRGGAAGVLILACPPRDCWNREGPRWLGERIYHGREAELQERVDRARVRIAYVNAAERRLAIAAVRAFQSDVAKLALPTRAAAPGLDVDTVCEPDEKPVGV